MKPSGVIVPAISLSAGKIVEGRVVKSVRYTHKGEGRITTTWATITPVEGQPFDVIVSFD